jgi:hypothetical protein
VFEVQIGGRFGDLLGGYSGGVRDSLVVILDVFWKDFEGKTTVIKKQTRKVQRHNVHGRKSSPPLSFLLVSRNPVVSLGPYGAQPVPTAPPQLFVTTP